MGVCCPSMFHSKPKKYLNVHILNCPVLTTNVRGGITDINEHFTAAFKWLPGEVIGQNIHILIPSKFIRLSHHDAKMKNYYFGRESRIIGRSRIVPILSANDDEVLVRIQIIPLGDKKDFSFMAILNLLRFTPPFFDFQTDFNDLQHRLEADPNEDFREDSANCKIVVKMIGTLFRDELAAVGDFIVENAHSESVQRMSKYFLLTAPIGRLSKLKKLMDRIFDNDDISYLNVTCLRLVFPNLVHRVDLTLVNELRNNLYSLSSGETSSDPEISNQ